MNEKDVRSVMEALPDAALLVDSDGRILGGNSCATRLLKYSD